MIGCVTRPTAGDDEALADESDESSTWQSSDRAPYVDAWELVDEGPADALRLLSIGGRLESDNFANRGDVEVVYDPSATLVTVEMQRFTIAGSPELAALALERMHYWPRNPNDPADAALDCFSPGTDACYIRNHYDGLAQPIRDGVNFRVTIPAGWDGELRITTSDNIADGLDTYPDRSDVFVDGLAGSLTVDLDSGEVEVRVDPAIDHYAGCAANDACELAGFDPACGCTDPTFLAIGNAFGHAANVTIDLPTTGWYDVRLETTSEAELGCSPTIDCAAFGPGCLIDPEFASLEFREVAEINYPGAPALPGQGIQVDASSQGCADVTYLEDQLDYELDTWPQEQRGDLLVCSGCL